MQHIESIIQTARQAFLPWMQLGFEQRYNLLQNFKQQLELQKDNLSETLSQEIGKPLWEAKTEITAMIGKLEISKQAYLDRCKDLSKDQQGVLSVTRHRPFGVVLVLGPFNFPGHLPNGHIIPALLAGNTVVYKPSELAAKFSTQVYQCWQAAKLPAGVINLVQGGADVGQYLVNHPELDGIYFTGSFTTGQKIQAANLQYPHKILALEMGGNNPLVVFEPDNIDAAVYNTIQSAFLTSGQRCSCARRLIVIDSPIGREFVQRLCEITKHIKVGLYTERPEPFMGPVVSNAAADKILAAYQSLVSSGAKVLVPLQRLKMDQALLSPSIIDVTGVQNLADEEIFGPLLNLLWVKEFAQALAVANNTAYGLSAGLLGGSRQQYEQFLQEVRAGVINWNRPITGASSGAPFGGLGKSGNHRPSAYYAADYCSYPIASLEEEKLQLPASLSPGISL